MVKLLIYIKWAIKIILAIIIILWVSYFFDCLNKVQHHFFIENNIGLNFLKWVNKVSRGVLVFRLRIFDDIFYIENFPGIIFFSEILFISLLVGALVLQKHKKKKYIMLICISILSFAILFEFFDSTLKLFVSG